jgi:adenosylhomocysteine nucleosidase
MESLGMLKNMSEVWIPTVGLRAISDTAQDDLPLNFDKCTNSRGQISLVRLLLQLALRPSRLSRLIEFGKQSRAAAVALADFLDRYVSALESCSSENIVQPKRVAAR